MLADSLFACFSEVQDEFARMRSCCSLRLAGKPVRAAGRLNNQSALNKNSV